MGTQSRSLQSPAASCRTSRGRRAGTESSGLQKNPLLGLFAAASVCILAQSRGLAGAQAVAVTPPFCRQKYSPLTSSGPTCVFHSPRVVLPSADTDVKPPSPPQLSSIFVSIFSLHFVVLQNCTCMNLGLLLCSLCHSWRIPAFPGAPRQPERISRAADENTVLRCRRGRTRPLKSHFRTFHHLDYM